MEEHLSNGLLFLVLALGTLLCIKDGFVFTKELLTGLAIVSSLLFFQKADLYQS